MKLLPLTVVLVLSFFFVAADDISDRGTNAANVAQAGLDACRNSNSNVKGNTIPYLTSNSYMFSAMGVLGGVLRFYHSRQMEKQFKNSMDELNQRFDWLEDDMNSRFDELTGFVDRKQFESDITDPTTILWGMMLAYAQYPNNKTYSNMMFECMRQTPWQIATKLHNRLFGPDNTLMTQIKSNQYNNGTFMATKDTIMYRIFQLMMIQSFCIGVENGPNYEFIADWEQQRMYSIYSDIVNNTIAMRKVQEKDYFNAVVPTIASQIVTGNAHDDMQYFASRLQQTLTQQYSWDSFGVVITDTTCNQADYQGSYNNGQGGIPYAVWHTNNLPCNVWVIRYWTGDQQYSRVGQYQNCMQACYNSNPHTWANCISCGQSFEILGNTWHCGYDMRTAGTRDYYYLDGITYKDGISSAVYPNANRRTTVEYDLGFWERPIGISLLPIPDN